MDRLEIEKHQTLSFQTSLNRNAGVFLFKKVPKHPWGGWSISLGAQVSQCHSIKRHLDSNTGT